MRNQYSVYMVDKQRSRTLANDLLLGSDPDRRQRTAAVSVTLVTFHHQSIT